MTIFFCDLVDSTAIEDGLDPELWRSVQLSYFNTVRSVISAHGGTIEKYIGDAVMAVFGVPQVHEDDAYRAVRAADDLRGALATLNEQLEREIGLRLSVRMGINTGEVVAGDATAGHGFVSGEPIVVAERLERSAASGEILIGDVTRRLVRSAALTEKFGPLELKGKARLVRAHRLLGVLRDAQPFPRRLEGPLVGRQSELTLLRRAFERATAAGAGHVFTVFGDAGVGKSRLVAEFLRHTEGTALQLQGRCLAYGDGITFWPLVSIIRQAGKIGRDLSPDGVRARMRELVADQADGPEIVARLTSVFGFDESPAPAEEIAWAVRRLLETLASDRPVLVVVDDLQWAEPAFLELVEYLGSWARDVPIVIVCLARPELLDARPAWGGGQANSTSMLLAPLTDEESRRLAVDVLGGELDAAAFGVIAGTAEGNPLFLEEVLGMLVEDGILRSDSLGTWNVEQLSSIQIPATIQALLAARLDRLAAHERAVLETAAVMGTVFRPDGLAELMHDDAVDPALETLSRKELVRRRSEPTGEVFWEFRHALIQSTTYAAIPRARRAAVHELFADWAERSYGERVAEVEEIIGYHLEQAFLNRREVGGIGPRERAVADRAAKRLASSGRRAHARGDPSAASSLLGRAAALLSPDDPGRGVLRVEFGAALTEAGRLSEAADLLDDVARSALAAGDERVGWLAVVERLLGRFQSDTQETSEQVPAVVAKARPVFERHHDDLGLCRLWRLQALVDWIGPSSAAADRAWANAAEHGRRAGNETERADCLCWLASSAFFGPLPASDGIDRCEATLREIEGHRQAVAMTLQPLAGLYAMTGQFEIAFAGLEQARAILDELETTIHSAVSHHEVFVTMLAGDLAASEALLRAGYSRLEGMGEKAILSTTAGLLADVLYRQGRIDEAEPLTRVSADTAADVDLSALIVWRRVRAKVLARQGRYDEARSLAEEAVAIAARTDWLNMRGEALLDLGEVLLAAGSAPEADKALRESAASFERKGNDVSARLARELLRGGAHASAEEPVKGIRASG